jgi:hypothetical protein
MRLLKVALLGAVCAASLSVAANAAVVISSAAGPDPGPRAGETRVIDFDPGLEAGVLLSGDFRITNTSVSGVTAAPLGDTTNFLTVPNATSSGDATMEFATFLGDRNVKGFSFYWGSIDSYNTLELLNRTGGVIASFTGNNFADPANGGQNSPLTNRRAYFDLTGADRELGALRFISTSYAFETDTFAFNVVPEPATWALMILGFGGVGAMVRHRRRQGPATA